MQNAATTVNWVHKFLSYFNWIINLCFCLIFMSKLFLQFNKWALSLPLAMVGKWIKLC